MYMSTVEDMAFFTLDVRHFSADLARQVLGEDTYEDAYTGFQLIPELINVHRMIQTHTLTPEEYNAMMEEMDEYGEDWET